MSQQWLQSPTECLFWGFRLCETCSCWPFPSVVPRKKIGRVVSGDLFRQTSFEITWSRKNMELRFCNWLYIVVHGCRRVHFQRFMWRDLVSQGCRMYLHLIISVHKYWLIAQRLGPHCMCYSKSRYHDIFYSNRNPRFENFSSLQMALLWMLTYSQEERKKLHAYSTQYFPLLCYIMQTYDQRQPSPTECIGWRLSEILNILRRLASCISCYTLKCAVLKVYRVWALPLEKKIDWKRTLQSIRTSQRRYLRHPIDVI
jgi:hypothetical protein